MLNMHLNLLELDERKLYKSLYLFFVKLTLKILYSVLINTAAKIITANCILYVFAN